MFVGIIREAGRGGGRRRCTEKFHSICGFQPKLSSMSAAASRYWAFSSPINIVFSEWEQCPKSLVNPHSFSGRSLGTSEILHVYDVRYVSYFYVASKLVTGF